MKIAFITHGMPHPSKGGSGHWHKIFFEFLSKNHEVCVIRINGRFKELESPDLDRSLEAKWLQQGITFIDIDWKKHVKTKKPFSAKIKSLLIGRIPLLRVLLFPPQVFNDCNRFPGLENILIDNRVDILVAVGPLCSMYASSIKKVCKISISCEVPHQNRIVAFENWKTDAKRSKLQHLYIWLENRIGYYKEKKANHRLLQTFHKVLYGAPHYFWEARAEGLTNIECIHLPIVTKPLKEKVSIKNRNTKFTILMLGHLYQTSNRSQLVLLTEDILPALERLFAEVEWEIRVIGNHSRIPEKYTYLKRHSHMNFIGPKTDLTSEYCMAQMILVPVPAKTGPRTKIQESLAYGLPIVAHIHNQLSVPELMHFGNAFLCETGTQMAQYARYIYENPDVAAQMAEIGKKVFASGYTDHVCTAQIERIITEVGIEFYKENRA